ncbi:ClpP family protease [Lientehia hominis]
MGKHKSGQKSGGGQRNGNGRAWYERVENGYHIGEEQERKKNMGDGVRKDKTEKEGQCGKADWKELSDGGTVRNSSGENGAENQASDNQVKDEKIQDYGQVVLDEGNGKEKGKIYLLSIIGEIEGHENLNSSSKTTKYEHVLPKLAQIEDSEDIDGVLLLINTQGGDVSSGLALAEMVASLSKPTVSLIIGDSHSIGVPLAVSADDSFIVPTATMLIHPVRMTGMTIGAPQTYHYFQRIQDRITGFVADHSKMPQDKIEELMMSTKDLTKDLGTLLVGEDTVRLGLIHQVGGIDKALKRLHEMIDERRSEA